MAEKSAKSDKKPPVKRKRATPLSFKKDDKVDSIVKEITENLKNSNETEAKLEEEVKLEVKGRISEEAPKEEPSETEESKGINESGETEESSGKKSEEKEATSDEKGEEVSEDAKTEDGDAESKEKPEGSAVFAPDKTDNPFPPLEEEKKKSFKWPLIYFILFLAGMVAGFVVFDQLSQRSGGNAPIRIGSNPSPTEEPSATPTKEPLDLLKYTIMLENGSGTAGVAADLQEQLEAADFNVEEIGNAENSNYEETVIQVKNGTNTEFLDALRSELEKTYTVAKDTEELPDSEEFDAVVIIGSQTSSNE